MGDFASRDEIIWAMEGDRRGWDLRKKTGGMVRSLIASVQHGDRLAAATREGLIYQLRQVLDTLGGAASFEYGPDYETEYDREFAAQCETKVAAQCETEYKTEHDRELARIEAENQIYLSEYETQYGEYEKDCERWEAFYRVAIHALEGMEPAEGEVWRRKRKPDLGRVLSKAQCLGLVDFPLNNEEVKQFLFKALCICLLTSGAIETLDEWERKQSELDLAASNLKAVTDARQIEYSAADIGRELNMTAAGVIHHLEYLAYTKRVIGGKKRGKTWRITRDEKLLVCAHILKNSRQRKQS